jgi:hypothetical protein
MTRLPKNPDGTVTIDGHVFARHNQTCIHCDLTLVTYKDGRRPCAGRPTDKKVPVED